MEITNKKIEGLRRRRESWVSGGAEAEDGAKWYYEHQVKIVDYDIEDAVKDEAKRRIRLSLKRIEKKLSEVAGLRQVVDMLLDEKVLGWTGYTEFSDELEKAFDLKKLRWG